MSDPRMAVITDMMNPGKVSAFDVRGSTHRGSNMTSTAYTFAARLVGIPVDQWKERAQNPATTKDFWERMKNANRIVQLDPSYKELLGGMSLMEIYNQSTRNSIGYQRLSEGVQKARNDIAGFQDGSNPWGFQVDVKSELKGTNLTGKQKDELYSSIRKDDFFHGANWKGLDPLSKTDRIEAFQRKFGDTPAQAMRKGMSSAEKHYLVQQSDQISGRIDKFIKKHSGLTPKDKTNVEITLSQNARQILEFVKQHKPTSNSQGSFSAPAITESSKSAIGLQTGNTDGGGLPLLYNTEGG